MNARRQWAGWIVLLLWTVPTGAAPRQSDIDWEAERPHEFVTRLKLSVRDKRDIVRLAARMGLTSPVHVVVDHHVPGFCEFVRVDSLVQPEGNHHAWLELQIRPTAWRACHALEPDATVKRVGRWVAASSDLTKRALWRLQDGDSWFVDVELDDDGMYADARVIASAIKRGQLIDRVPGIQLTGERILRRPVPEVNADQISSIRRDTKTPGGYEVSVGRRAGNILFVRIVNSAVEVYELSSWIQ
jgi:hypothetical protein